MYEIKDTQFPDSFAELFQETNVTIFFTKILITTGELQSSRTVLSFREKYKVNKLALGSSKFRDKSELDVVMGTLNTTVGNTPWGYL